MVQGCGPVRAMTCYIQARKGNEGQSIKVMDRCVKEDLISTNVKRSWHTRTRTYCDKKTMYKCNTINVI